jgi:hypothetical protein
MRDPGGEGGRCLCVKDSVGADAVGKPSVQATKLKTWFFPARGARPAIWWTGSSRATAVTSHHGAARAQPMPDRPPRSRARTFLVEVPRVPLTAGEQALVEVLAQSPLESLNCRWWRVDSSGTEGPLMLMPVVEESSRSVGVHSRELCRHGRPGRC